VAPGTVTGVFEADGGLPGPPRLLSGVVGLSLVRTGCSQVACAGLGSAPAPGLAAAGRDGRFTLGTPPGRYIAWARSPLVTVDGVERICTSSVFDVESGSTVHENIVCQLK
jgi:hypothetical protein